MQTLLFLLTTFYLLLGGADANFKINGTEDEGRYVLPGKIYPLTLFPFLDQLNIPSIYRRSHYLRFLFQCVFFQGHCDLMGKWLKPRAMSAIFGTCLVCTPNQTLNMETWLLGLIEANPTLFRAAMVKVCWDMELPISSEDKALIQPFLKVKKT